MVKSLDDNSVYILGGEDYTNSKTSNKILAMKCPDKNPASCYFEEIETRLNYPRFGHVALSITHELAKELCQ